MATSRLIGGNQRLQLLRHLDYLEKEQVRDAEETPDTHRFQLHDLCFLFVFMMLPHLY